MAQPVGVEADKATADDAPAEQPETAPPGDPEAAQQVEQDSGSAEEDFESEAPQVPGKDESAEEAEDAGPAKGKSAVEVPAAKSKGKPGSAPAAQPADDPSDSSGIRPGRGASRHVGPGRASRRYRFRPARKRPHRPAGPPPAQSHRARAPARA